MNQNHSGRICVSIAAPTVAAALALARQEADKAEVIEIRLDALDQPEVLPFLEELRVPLLFTNRPVWEGGGFTGEEEARISLLVKAIESGAAHVDIELRTEPSLQQRILAAARERGARVIVSWHDFKTTPSAQGLADIFQRQYRSGAQIGKIATTARDFRDVLRVLSLQEQAAEMDFPLIAFCMGKPGMISRLATLALNGYMSYAAPDHGPTTAPGQLTVTDLRAMREKF